MGSTGLTSVKKIPGFLLSTLAASCFLLAFSSGREELQSFEMKGYAQGTSFQVSYYAEREQVKRPQIDSLLELIDESMSLYRSTSTIKAFNASEKGVQIDTHFRKVMQKAILVFQETDGLFDVTVGPLVAAWGFGPDGERSRPDQQEIDSLKRFVGSQQLELRGDSLLKTRPEIQVDVNGIAQGYTVDLLADFLASKGIKNYLVEVGGELRVAGSKTGGQPFRIGIEGPDDKGEAGLVHIVQLNKGAITTSGNYRKYIEDESKRRRSHLIDPRSGYPLDTDLLSVTLYAKDALNADAYDNALMGMGMKQALCFTEQQKDMEAYFVFKNTEGLVCDTMTSGFKKMLVNN